jgi:integrase
MPREVRDAARAFSCLPDERRPLYRAQGPAVIQLGKTALWHQYPSVRAASLRLPVNARGWVSWIGPPAHLRPSRPTKMSVSPNTNAPDTPCSIVGLEANTGTPLKGDFERMSRRRYQSPKPFRRGAWWYLQYWQDVFVAGRTVRKRVWTKLAPASMPEREVNKIAAEKLRPLNQGLESLGSATNFTMYVNETYIPVEMPSLASSTRERYRGVIANYLIPAFGKLCLREITTLAIQRYFSATLASSELSHESKDKIRDVLSSVLGSAVKYGLLVKNPAENVRLPADRRGKRYTKPVITPDQFDQLMAKIPEPYATMVFVAVMTGLRVSELIGLRWNDIHEDSITIDERYCRGDWGSPKTESSAATIAVHRSVIERIQRLKFLTVEVRAGRAVRKYRIVKSDGPNDLVFQSVKDGKPIRDNNTLTRFLKPAARELGMPWMNWRSLRTSHATWLKMAGADVKDAQAQMRHSRASTTLDIYQQFVPESQRRAVDRLGSLGSQLVT